MMVSELLCVKIQNTLLKLRELERVHADLTAERDRYIAQARQEVSAPADYVLNTDSREFVAPAGAPMKPARAKVKA